jgi:hypothetical protein
MFKRFFLSLAVMVIITDIVEVLGDNSVSAFSDGSYNFSWSIDTMMKTITMNLDVATTGWVGVGLSPDGTMPNSDVIICYVNKSGVAVCSDRFAQARAAPPTDVSLGGKDDLTNVTGSVVNGRTKISFTRSLNTGDKWDIPITQGTAMNVLFSYRANGNPDTENGQFLQHTNQGGKKIILYPAANQATNLDSYKNQTDVRMLSYKFDKYQIPAQQTTYMCKYFNTQQLVSQTTKLATNTSYHAIVFEPVVDNSQRVHHLVLYGCDASAVKWTDNLFECSNMPTACNIFVFGWAPGVDSFILPPEAGYIWGTYENQINMLQIHYDNTPLVAGSTDSTGLNIYYTTKLRQYDAGLMILGKPYQVMSIPPGKPAYNITSYCLNSCTKSLSGPINIINYIPHGHQLMTALYTYVDTTGNGTYVSLSDPNYSFQHQSQHAVTGVKLYPGFQAMTSCIYDSTKQTSTVLGGESTSNEMCFNFVSYYPRENGLFYCFSDTDGCDQPQTIKRVLSACSLSVSWMLLFLIVIFI